MKTFIILILTFNLFADCNGKFFSKTPIVQGISQEVCFDDFAVLYSNEYKIPLVSFEKLDKSKVEKAKLILRRNTFHSEVRVQDGPTVKDYYNSGYDKGHMSPSANMGSKKAQYESFSMINMIPQVHGNNAGTWKKLEEQARRLALKYTIYVVSGPIITGNETKLNQRVLVPSILYKSIYVVELNSTSIYILKNDNKGDIIKMDKQMFINTYNINPFP